MDLSRPNTPRACTAPLPARPDALIGRAGHRPAPSVRPELVEGLRRAHRCPYTALERYTNCGSHKPRVHAGLAVRRYAARTAEIGGLPRSLRRRCPTVPRERSP